MKLAGTLTLDRQEYFLMLKELKNSTTWYLFSKRSKKDRERLLLGEPLQDQVMNLTTLCSLKQHDDSYLLAVLELKKISSGTKGWGNITLLEKLLKNFHVLDTYVFSKNAILRDEHIRNEKDMLSVTHKFAGSDGNYDYSFKKEDGFFSYIDLLDKHTGFALKASALLKPKTNITVELQEIQDNLLKRSVEGLSIQNVTEALLREVVDLSWFRDYKTGQLRKDYKVIENIPDFEEYVMGDIINEMKRCKKEGRKFLFSLDTESTGLVIYNLSDSNPQKDHLVATPLSWRDNQGVLVYNDMEYFDNVPADYMFARLKPLLEGNSDLILATGKTSAPLLVEQRKFFDTNASAVDIEELLNPNNYEVVNSVLFPRTDIVLIGHNVMFDGRVCLCSKVKPYWNEDTLQMAFDLNPTVAKIPVNIVVDEETEDDFGYVVHKQKIKKVAGGVGLKNITRRLLHCETAELSDVLGKGNEDKFRYLADKIVTMIYGCADSDFTRLCYKKLKEIMPEHLYNMYQEQDIPLLNILYEAEFEGLTIDEKRVKELGEQAKEDLDRIHEFLQVYVGTKMAYRVEYDKLSIKFKQSNDIQLQAISKLKNGLVSYAEYQKIVSSLYTEDDFRRDVKNIKIDKAVPYEFEMKGSCFRTVLYDILKYPITGYTKGDKPLASVDKNAMKKLMSVPGEHNELAEDLISTDGKTVLISAKDFNSKKYPVAYVLSVYASLNKEYTSYFKPIAETNMEGKLYKNFSMTRIETRRIMNPSQTMKGSLKALTLPYGGYNSDWYMVDWDMAQVEYRNMVSISGQTNMVERLKDPEKDFHTESASSLSGIPAYLIEKDFRKKMKSVHFGIPYGLGDKSMCEAMNGGKCTPKLLADTRELKLGFENANRQVIDFLNRARDNALQDCPEISDELKRFAGFVTYTENLETGQITEQLHRVGRVTNEKGFYRLFDLEDLTPARIGSIRRMAGNYPIQSFAAELFRYILIRFYRRCYKEGISDKIRWHLLIHDELLLSAHKSVHPFFLYKILLEECMVTFPGHTNYFIGINIGYNWKQCKDDASEAPVIFVQRMVERWDKGEFANEKWIDDPKAYVDKFRYQYLRERIHEVISTLYPVDDLPIDSVAIAKEFENYTVRAYLNDFFVPECCQKKGPCGKWYKGLRNSQNKTAEEIARDEDMAFKVCLAQWVKEFYPNWETKEILLSDGQITTIAHFLAWIETECKSDIIVSDQEVATAFDFDDNGYWSFNESSFGDGFLDGEDELEMINEYEDYELPDVKEGESYVSAIMNEHPKNYMIERDNDWLVNSSELGIEQSVANYLAKKGLLDTRLGQPLRFLSNPKASNPLKVSKKLSIEQINSIVENHVYLLKNKKRKDLPNFKFGKDNLGDIAVVISAGNESSFPDKFMGELLFAQQDIGFTVYLQSGNSTTKMTKCLPYNYDFNTLQNLISPVKALKFTGQKTYNNISIKGNYLEIRLMNLNARETVKNYLKSVVVPSQGYTVKFVGLVNTEIWLKINKKTNLKKLDDFVGRLKYEAVRAN